MATTTRYRPPTSALRSWRRYGAEIACMAQLLYMYDLLDLPPRLDEGDQVTPGDMAALEARAGGADHADPELAGIDLDGGVERILLEEGFHLRHVTGDDLHRLATDAAYHRELLIAEGHETVDYLDEMLPVWTPIVQRRTAARLDLYAQFASQVEVIREPSSWAAVEQLLGEGFHVDLSTLNDDGTGRACLVVAELAPGRHLLFEPIAAGVMETSAAAATIGDRMVQGIHGWRFPGAAS